MYTNKYENKTYPQSRRTKHSCKPAWNQKKYANFLFCKNTMVAHAQYMYNTLTNARTHTAHTHTHTHTQHGAACTFTYPGTKFACIRRVREHICIVNTSIQRTHMYIENTYVYREHICIVNTSIQSTHICIGALACIRRVREHIYIENTYVSREHIYSENIYIENTHMYSYIGVHIRLVREHLYTENTYIQGTHVNREHIYTENAFCTCIVNTSM